MVNEIKATANEKMDKALKNLNESLGSLRAGRANPRIPDKVMAGLWITDKFESIGKHQYSWATHDRCKPLWSTAIPAIEKGILKSDLGFNPSNDGKIIRLLTSVNRGTP